MREFKFELGDVIKDEITGFTGVVMARSQYHTGCHTYGLLSQALGKDGKPIEWEWFDDQRLIATKKKALFERPIKPNGGPHPNAPQM